MPGKTKAAVIILWIGAALACVGGLLFLVALNSVAASDGGIATLLIVIVLASGALNALFAIAIQNRQNWARITAIVLCAIGIPLQAINLFSGDVSAVLGLALNIVIIVMLASEESKAWCGR
ncbi:hypothetical protein [Glycomyces rhizosphaerae]|uniref:SPW repeat-containing protein n=1 Tax=Glycomyces rhizosphaerae TaxID=2054422 RepID=A0ABV7Q8U0_9ACTN